MSKQVYISISADFIHHGIINILKEAAKYGEVTVGLLTDTAIAAYKKLPFMTYNERLQVIESLKYVSNVVEQDNLDPTANIMKLKPDYVVHGDDWREGFQKPYRDNVLKCLDIIGGNVVRIWAKPQS